MKKLIVLLLALLMSLSLLACEKDASTTGNGNTDNSTTGSSSNDQSENSSEHTPETPSRPDFQMSNNPEDFTVTVNGLVYQLPCSMELFLSDSWVPKSGYVLENDYTIPSGETRTVVAYNTQKDNMVSVKSYYTAKGASAYRDGSVIGFHSEEDSTAVVELSGGLKLDENLTLQDVVSVFGNDYTYSKFNGDRYVYRFESKGLYIFTFENDRLTYWEIRIYEDAVK